MIKIGITGSLASGKLLLVKYYLLEEDRFLVQTK